MLRNIRAQQAFPYSCHIEGDSMHTPCSPRQAIIPALIIALVSMNACRHKTSVVQEVLPDNVPEQALAPTLSPAGGTYTADQTITLTTASDGATLYYTLDGTNPTDASTLYIAPITLTGDDSVAGITTQIRAIAMADNLAPSDISSATYVIRYPHIPDDQPNQPPPPPDAPATFTIGGTINGLVGTVVLQNRNGDALSLTQDGSFIFSQVAADGDDYLITVSTQPAQQTCVVTHGTGTVTAANVSAVAVQCTTNTYTVRGTVTGLSSTLVLRNTNLNSVEDLAISANGAFAFTVPLADGTDYAVTVLIQPSNVITCTATHASGTIAGADVTNVSVACVHVNADLASLTLSAGSLSPSFSGTVISYTGAANFLEATTMVTVASVDPSATITVNGTTVASGATSESIALSTGANNITVVVTTPDSATTKTYTIAITRQTFSAFAQQAYVKASNTDVNDAFGKAIAIDGDTMVVGAYAEDSNATGVNGNQGNGTGTTDEDGAVYVFVRSGTDWEQQAYLKPSHADPDKEFGASVAIAGNTIVVGAPRENSGANTINGDPADNSSGYSGAVYVFTRSGTTWSQQAYIKASNAASGDLFGSCVAISGDTIAVGAPEQDSTASNSGAAYLFVRSGTIWSQQAMVKASNAGSDNYFGHSIGISGDSIVVGADSENSSATGTTSTLVTANSGANYSGAAYVFVRSGSTWSQEAYLKASNTRTFSWFANSVAISGDTIVVGAPYESSNATGVDGTIGNYNTKSSSGAAYVFVRSAGSWSQQAYVKASNTMAYALFGYSVSLSNNAMVIGAYGELSSATGVNGSQTNTNTTDAGAAYLFTRSGSTWTQQAYLKASNTGASDQFGLAVAVSGGTIAVGAFGEDGDASGTHGTSNDGATDSGAAYVFY